MDSSGVRQRTKRPAGAGCVSSSLVRNKKAQMSSAASAAAAHIARSASNFVIRRGSAWIDAVLPDFTAKNRAESRRISAE